MTAAQLRAAWDDSTEHMRATRDQDAFYSKFEELSGLTRDDISRALATWSELPHAEAVEISEKHGMQRGDFCAYLAEVSV